jgi:hypothetical protein
MGLTFALIAFEPSLRRRSLRRTGTAVHTFGLWLRLLGQYGTHGLAIVSGITVQINSCRTIGLNVNGIDVNVHSVHTIQVMDISSVSHNDYNSFILSMKYSSKPVTCFGY